MWGWLVLGTELRVSRTGAPIGHSRVLSAPGQVETVATLLGAPGPHPEMHTPWRPVWLPPWPLHRPQ